MLFSDITMLDEDLEVREHMYVGTRDERIVYIGSEPPAEDFGEVFDGRDRLLMPGFYNAHAHSPMSLMRGYGENLTLKDWLNQKILPFEDQFDNSAVYWATMLCMAESLKAGIVSSSDMYFFVDDIARAVLDSGCKNNISRSQVSFDATPFMEMQSTAELLSLKKEFDGAGGGRIKVEGSLHAEYSSNEKLARSLADWCRENGMRMHVHASETNREHEECKARHGGMTPIEYMDSCGLFDVPAAAAHCVWIEGRDYDILKEKGVTVVTNPCSNLKLASGICDTAEILKRGIRLAVGTDGVASNNSLDFLQEIKLMAMLGKVRAKDPTAITPKQALFAATRGGALAQGREDCGLMKEGMRADLIVMRTDVPEMHPIHDLVNNIVYSSSSSDICMTMVDGRVLYKDGEYVKIDIEKTLAEVDSATRRILDKLH